MGWFSRNNEQPTQQFGAPSTCGAAGGGMGYGMQQNGMMGGGMRAHQRAGGGTSLVMRHPRRPQHPMTALSPFGAFGGEHASPNSSLASS